MGKELKTLSRCSAPHVNPSLNNSLVICNSSSHYLFFLFHPIVTCPPSPLKLSKAKSLNEKEIKNDSQIDVSLFSAYSLTLTKENPSLVLRSPLNLSKPKSQWKRWCKLNVAGLFSFRPFEIWVCWRFKSSCQRHPDRPKRPYWWRPFFFLYKKNHSLTIGRRSS